MRFLFVLVSLAVACAAVYFTVLFWGQGRPISRFDHAFDLKGKPYLVVPWDSALKLGELHDRAAKANVRVTLVTWLDVYRDEDGALRVLPFADRPKAQDTMGAKVPHQGPALEEVLAPLGSGPVVISVLSNAENIDQQLVRAFETHPKAKVLVQSEFDNVMGSTKIAKPMWSYGTSSSDRVRWMTFSSIGLLPAVTVTGDVFLAPLKVRALPAVNEVIVAEAHRRFLSVILGPLADANDAAAAQKFDADGYFVASPEAFEALKLF